MKRSILLLFFFAYTFNLYAYANDIFDHYRKGYNETGSRGYNETGSRGYGETGPKGLKKIK